jgi:hypothetical protein
MSSAVGQREPLAGAAWPFVWAGTPLPVTTYTVESPVGAARSGHMREPVGAPVPQTMLASWFREEL